MNLRRFSWKYILVLPASLLVMFVFQNCGTKFQLPLKPTESSSKQLFSLSAQNQELSGSIRGRISYFGFFADGMAGVAQGNYIGETSRIANMHMVTGDEADTIAKVKAAKSQGGKVILMYHDVIFVPGSLKLRDNYKEMIKNFYGWIRNAHLEDAILGVYLYDEPFWKDAYMGYNHKIDPVQNPYPSIGAEQVYRNLELAAAAVKEELGPGKIVISSEAHTILKQNPNSPETKNYGMSYQGFPGNIDWIAANCYLNYNNDRETPCDTNEKYESLVQIVVDHLKPNQSIFVTLDNYWPVNPSSVPNLDDKLLARNEFQVRLALKYNAAAVMSFIYQDDTVNSQWGISSFPKTYAFVQDVGFSITGKARGPQFLCTKSEYACGDTVECVASGKTNSLEACDSTGKCIPLLGASGWVHEETGVFSFRLVNNHSNKQDAGQEWSSRENGLYSTTMNVNLKTCNVSVPANLPSCESNWKEKESRTCQGAQIKGEVCGCLPQGYSNPNLWVDHGNGCFSHIYAETSVGGLSCAAVAAPLKACSDWRNQETKFCLNNQVQGEICGCLPEAYDNPNVWVNKGGGCYSHTYGDSVVDGFSCR